MMDYRKIERVLLEYFETHKIDVGNDGLGSKHVVVAVDAPRDSSGLKTKGSADEFTLERLDLTDLAKYIVDVCP